MPVQWSGLSPEVLLTLDRAAPEPLRSQLERQLRDAIRSGRLGVGERLPSSRELARELGLSRGLVQECFAQLQAEGYLSTRVGSATSVAERAERLAGRPAAGDLAAAERSEGEPLARGPRAPARSAGELTPAKPALAVNFISGVPDLASFPR